MVEATCGIRETPADKTADVLTGKNFLALIFLHRFMCQQKKKLRFHKGVLKVGALVIGDVALVPGRTSPVPEGASLDLGN